MISLQRVAAVTGATDHASTALRALVGGKDHRFRLAVRPAIAVPGLQTEISLVRDVVVRVVEGDAPVRYPRVRTP